ncbi:MAG: ribonuclease P protein component 4 [Candidatus Heimdallarchaeaceae archaeon]
MSSKKTSAYKPKRRRRKKAKIIIIEREEVQKQIRFLLKKADILMSKKPELAQNYAQRAKKIQIKTRTRFPSEWRKRFCKHCKTFLYPGINAQYRLSSSNKVVAIKCLHCNSYTRIPYYKKMVRRNEKNN